MVFIAQYSLLSTHFSVFYSVFITQNSTLYESENIVSVGEDYALNEL